MTFTEAVAATLRHEVSLSSQEAVGRLLAFDHSAIRWWTKDRDDTAGPGFRYSMVDAVVATFGLATIVRHLGPDARIALYGACESCNERPKAGRGLYRRCRTCIRLTGLRAQAGEGAPS